jgi:hypothetical protein
MAWMKRLEKAPAYLTVQEKRLAFEKTPCYIGRVITFIE